MQDVIATIIRRRPQKIKSLSRASQKHIEDCSLRYNQVFSFSRFITSILDDFVIELFWICEQNSRRAEKFSKTFANGVNFLRLYSYLQ